MIIKNNLNAAIPIPDVLIQGGNGIVIAPLTTITIFNAAADASKVLPLFFTAGILSNQGSAEPALGNGMQVAGAPGPKGDPGTSIISFTAAISSGTVSGANLVLPLTGLLATDKIVSVCVDMGANPGRSTGGAVNCMAGYTAHVDGSLTIVFVDGPPPSGYVTVSVTR